MSVTRERASRIASTIAALALACSCRSTSHDVWAGARDIAAEARTGRVEASATAEAVRALQPARDAKAAARDVNDLAERFEDIEALAAKVELAASSVDDDSGWGLGRLVWWAVALALLGALLKLGLLGTVLQGLWSFGFFLGREALQAGDELADAIARARDEPGRAAAQARARLECERDPKVAIAVKRAKKRRGLA